MLKERNRGAVQTQAGCAQYTYGALQVAVQVCQPLKSLSKDGGAFDVDPPER